jgi:hypothetical protein
MALGFIGVIRRAHAIASSALAADSGCLDPVRSGFREQVDSMMAPESYPFSNPSRSADPTKSSPPVKPAIFPAAPSGVLVGISHFAGTDSLPRLPEGMPALRILIVDDDAPVRKACCEIASGMGLVPFAAGTVPEALAALQRQRVDTLGG